MKRKICICLVFGLIALVVACGSIYEKEPVGIGTEYSELKKSPCACLKLDLAPELPAWLS
ncbi:MAG: hypothetical protein J6Y85_00655 [Alphaproteobacteria bacterium]|nr:hypothetical protein [Alphaproteobacteria bacterium]